MKNLFILESSNGNHHTVPKEFEADKLSFAFIVNLSHNTILREDDFSYLMPKSLSNVCLNDNFISLSSFLLIDMLIKRYNKVFIGTDMDIEGNAMAKILLDFCLHVTHKDKKDIIRIPLTQNGYIGVSDFWDNDTMLEYLNNRKDELAFIQKSKSINGSYGVGRRTMLLANEILNPPAFVKNTNTEGTSTITYLFKKAIKEK